MTLTAVGTDDGDDAARAVVADLRREYDDLAARIRTDRERLKLVDRSLNAVLDLHPQLRDQSDKYRAARRARERR